MAAGGGAVSSYVGIPPAMAKLVYTGLSDALSNQPLEAGDLVREWGAEIFEQLHTNVTDRLSTMRGPKTAARQAREFLMFAWNSLTQASGAPFEKSELKQCAISLGQFLAGVPGEKAHAGFKAVLTEWAVADQRDASKREDDMLTLVVTQPPRRKDFVKKKLPFPQWPRTPSHKRLRELLEPLSPPRGDTDQRLKFARRCLRFLWTEQEKLTPKAMVQAVVVCVEAAPVFLASGTNTLREMLITRLEENDGAETVASIWPSLGEAPVLLRLGVLQACIESESRPVRVFFRGHALPIVNLCAEVAQRLRTNALSDPRARRIYKEKALKLLKQLCADPPDGGPLPVKAHHVLTLAHVFGKDLRPPALWLLDSLLQRMVKMPSVYAEADFIAAAIASEDILGCHESLAQAILARWYGLKPGLLWQAMRHLPVVMRGAPQAFNAILLGDCVHHRTLLRGLSLEQTSKLIQRWQELDVPPEFHSWLSCPIEQHIDRLDGRDLMTASKMMSSGPDDELKVLQSWRRWVERAVAGRTTRGWNRCMVSLREARRWRQEEERTRRTIGTTRSEQVQRVLAIGISKVILDAPVELGLEVAQAISSFSLHHNDAQEQLDISDPAGLEELAELTETATRLRVGLEQRVRRALRGEGRSLTIASAVAVANGETPVHVEEETLFWNSLVLCVAYKLRTRHDMELLFACKPTKQLRASLIRAAEGWQALELQLRCS